jgi:hypothetical protein
MRRWQSVKLIQRHFILHRNITSEDVIDYEDIILAFIQLKPNQLDTIIHWEAPL